MGDILHRAGIKASLADVYKALATRDGLAGWLTTNTQGDGKVGGIITLGFTVDGRPASLKALLETGKGAPNPDDVQISDWH